MIVNVAEENTNETLSFILNMQEVPPRLGHRYLHLDQDAVASLPEALVIAVAR